MSATPNLKYNSGAVPFSTFFVDIFRLADPGDNATGAKLGQYLVESMTPTDSSIVQKRPNIDGGKNGWQIVEGDCEGSITIQRNVQATPSLKNGDYFDAALRVGSDGAPVTERFVLHQPAHSFDAGYRKQSMSFVVDDRATGLTPTNTTTPT
jgi:hypothetical protein